VFFLVLIFIKRQRLKNELLGWSQEENEVYFSIRIPDVVNPVIDLTEQTLDFVGESAGKKYEIRIDFYEMIDPAVN
jgi:hypothetical protein